MKVLIAGFTTKKFMPYLEKYIRVLQEENCEYDIIYMDREMDETSCRRGNEFFYFYKMPIEKKIWSKFLPYFGYMKYAGKILRKGHYDKIIFLTTAPAVLLSRNYLKKYAGNYILDYRDYTFEKIGVYQKLVKKIIRNSYAAFISSEGFKTFVGNDRKIHITHNISNLEELSKHCGQKPEGKITIGFVGCVRYFDVNTRLIDCCSKCSDIELLYAGTAYDDCNLKSYCEEKNIVNVSFIESFDNSEKRELYEKITFVNSIYSLKSPEVLQAVPNRLYDAAIFRKPILVSKGTFLEKIVDAYKIGLAVDVFSEDITEVIQKYMENFDTASFEQNCSRFLEDVMRDEKNWKKIMRDFLRR